MSYTVYRYAPVLPSALNGETHTMGGYPALSKVATGTYTYKTYNTHDSCLTFIYSSMKQYRYGNVNTKLDAITDQFLFRGWCCDGPGRVPPQ